MAITRDCCICGRSIAIHGIHIKAKTFAHQDCLNFATWMAPLYEELGWLGGEVPQPEIVYPRGVKR